MALMKTLPREASVLSTAQRLKYLFIANRLQIGIFLLACITFAGTFYDDDNIKVHQRLHTIEVVIGLVTGAGVAGGLIGAAKFKDDDAHGRQMEAAIRSESGQYPVYRDRSGDRAAASFLDGTRRPRDRR